MIQLLLLAIAAQVDPPDLTLLSVTPDRTEAVAGGKLSLAVKVSIAPGWHIYSVKPNPKTLPTAFTFENGVKVAGQIGESAPKRDAEGGYDFHEGEPLFTIPVRIPPGAKEGTFDLKGAIEYQACNESMCHMAAKLPIQASIKITPGKDEAPATTPGVSPAPAGSGAAQELEEKGLMWLLGLSVLGGLISLVMPCVFPLIPITLTYFIKQAGSSRSTSMLLSSAYAIGIIVSFTAIGFLLTLLLGGATGARQFAQSPWTNLAIAALFFAFALSLLGLFEIKLPDALMGRLAGGGPKTGLPGAFLLGLLFSVVTFACTIPIAATILGIAASDGHRLAGLLAMFVYSATMALPFFLLGLFPSMIKEVPKSGGWLHTVKVTAGFLEIALAVAYLWKSDGRWEWGIFDRPTVIAIWIGVFFVTSFYLFGLFRMKGDGEAKEIGVSRALAGLLMMILGFILVGGLDGRPLPLFGTVLPPNLETRSGTGSEGASLKVYDNLDEAELASKREGKPLFIEFTGIT